LRPTPYAEVNELIDVLLSEMIEILGPRLVGLYTFGSLVAGDFDEERSDVDLVAALSDDLDDEEFARLERMHLVVVRRDRRWEERIEVGYIATAKLRRIEPGAEIALISPGEPFHFKQAGTSWLFNLHTVREQGATIVGPPPATLIDPIGTDGLVAAMRPLMREWREWVAELPDVQTWGYQGYMVVTLCRALYTFRTGAQASKQRAAAWAMAELPEWSSLIGDALRWREAGDAEQADRDATLPQTLRFVHFVIDSILAWETDGAPRSRRAGHRSGMSAEISGRSSRR